MAGEVEQAVVAGWQTKLGLGTLERASMMCDGPMIVPRVPWI